MGYSFKYWTNRWKSVTTVHLTHTPEGWHLGAMAHTGNCDKSGAPNVFSNFDQDYVKYPHGIGMFLEWLWGRIDNGECSHEEAQERIQQLADWVSTTEKAEPKWPGWN